MHVAVANLYGWDMLGLLSNGLVGASAVPAEIPWGKNLDGPRRRSVNKELHDQLGIWPVAQDHSQNSTSDEGCDCTQNLELQDRLCTIQCPAKKESSGLVVTRLLAVGCCERYEESSKKS